MKAIIIGRHQGEIPGVEVVRQENIQFPAHSEEIWPILREFDNELAEINVDCVLLQMCPGQVAVSLARALKSGALTGGWGIIISKPAPRLFQRVQRFWFTDGNMCDLHKDAMELVAFVNPNSKVEYNEADCCLKVTVDPPMQFEFSHIEWFKE